MNTMSKTNLPGVHQLPRLLIIKKEVLNPMSIWEMFQTRIAKTMKTFTIDDMVEALFLLGTRHRIYTTNYET